MTIIQFINYGVGKHRCSAPVECRVRQKDSKFEPGQACSVRELFIRQQQGLPLPPMTTGFVFNGLGLDELPASSGRYADKSAKIAELQHLQNELKKDGLQYRVTE